MAYFFGLSLINDLNSALETEIRESEIELYGKCINFISALSF